jgi:hypothetical protein
MVIAYPVTGVAKWARSQHSPAVPGASTLIPTAARHVPRGGGVRRHHRSLAGRGQRPRPLWRAGRAAGRPDRARAAGGRAAGAEAEADDVPRPRSERRRRPPRPAGRRGSCWRSSRRRSM